MYGFGGASGSVFGASWLGIQQELITRVGVWNNEDIDTSSNHREYRNNVESLETAGERGELQGREFFFFTDNQVSESIKHKGNSSSESLFLLTLCLNMLEMKYKCRIHLIHIAGTHMIVQGTDGGSRGGDFLEGVFK